MYISIKKKKDTDFNRKSFTDALFGISENRNLLLSYKLNKNNQSKNEQTNLSHTYGMHIRCGSCCHRL